MSAGSEPTAERPAAKRQESLPPSSAYFESINGDLYLWRIGEITAEDALEGIAAWVLSVEQGEKHA